MQTQCSHLPGSEFHRKKFKVCSLLWGFSLGGVGKYISIIDNVSNGAPIDLNHICILGRNWPTDNKTLAKLDAEKVFIRSRADFSWHRRVRAEINKLSPDLLMTHGFNGHVVAMSVLPFLQSKPRVVCSYHGLYHATTPVRSLVQPAFNAATEYFVRHYATSVLSVSKHSKKYLINRGIEGSKIYVVHNGLADAFPVREDGVAARAEWGVSEDTFLIGVASRVDPVKGLTYLIDAIGKVAPIAENVKLVIVGTGTVEQDLRRQAEVLGISDRVIFAGFRSDIDRCLQAFDLFALPSLAEYHSIALLEAMRAARPIVATDVGGNTESVRDGQEGLIVPPGNADTLASAIEKIATDRRLAETLGQAARKRFLQEFTKETMVQRTANWLIESAGHADPS